MTPPIPQYSLRLDLRHWHLTFAGQPAILKHEQGLFYVAYLLTHPPAEPIHGLALALKATALYRKQQNGAATEILDPSTARPATIASDAALVERNLVFDAAEAAWSLRRKQRELEALLDDPSESEPIKAEATRQLEEIYDHQKNDPAKTTDIAQKTVRAVRMAIRRLHARLANALHTNGHPHPVLVPFANHLQTHLLLPSARYSSRNNSPARPGLAGSFTYEPPPEVSWNRTCHPKAESWLQTLPG